VRTSLDLAPAAGGKKEAATAQRRSRVLQPRPPPPATRGKMKEASPLLSPHGRRICRCLAPPHFCPSPAPSAGAREERFDGGEIRWPCAPLHLRRRWASSPPAEEARYGRDLFLTCGRRAVVHRSFSFVAGGEEGICKCGYLSLCWRRGGEKKKKNSVAVRQRPVCPPNLLVVRVILMLLLLQKI
jgi:hypothetical protein